MSVHPTITTSFLGALAASRLGWARHTTLIHPLAWKKKRNSPKFTVANGSSTHRQALDDRPCCSPSAPKRSDLVLFVAPLCIKEVRLVTARLPEESSPFGPGLNQLPLLRVLRSSATEPSRKLTAYRAMLDPHGGCRQLAEEERVLGTL